MEPGFNRALAADPNDHTTRQVYADWLDENGHAEPAARLRWIVGAHQHPNPYTIGTTYYASTRIPQRYRRLLALHHLRQAHNNAEYAQAERHFLGVDPTPPTPLVRSVIDEQHANNREAHEYGDGIYDPAFSPAIRRAAGYAIQHPPPEKEAPTRLAAIAPPTDVNGVLVRVPQAPAAPRPAAPPAKMAPPRAARTGRTGPAFILPQ